MGTGKLSGHLSIYPSTGFTYAPPNVADPIKIVPFDVTFYEYDITSKAFESKKITIGVAWDDDVNGAGGLCQTLTNYLQYLWANCIAQIAQFRIVDTNRAVQEICLPGSNFYQMDNIATCRMNLLQAAPQTDYWYKSKDFAKFGWASFYEANGQNSPPQFWNFANQDCLNIDFGSAGVEVFLIGPGALGVVTVIPYAEPPAIQFTGFGGFTGTYDHTGLH